MYTKVVQELEKLRNPQRAAISQRFFKTGKGEYGEGDVFIGLTVPQMRSVANNHLDLSIGDVTKLLHSDIHERRFIALVLLVDKYKKGDDKVRQRIYDYYLKNTRWINNWDLVDTTAHKIVGFHLMERPRYILYKLAQSKDLWERRIAIIATAHFISNDQFEDTLKISEILINDEEDLIHKAVGWMLREVGKRDQLVEEEFLEKYYKKMPRTMLRYAIEKFSDAKKAHFMAK